MCSICVSDGAIDASRERTELNANGKKTDLNQSESPMDAKNLKLISDESRVNSVKQVFQHLSLKTWNLNLAVPASPSAVHMKSSDLIWFVFADVCTYVEQMEVVCFWVHVKFFLAENVEKQHHISIHSVHYTEYKFFVQIEM